jgi:hypothetical protein
MRKDFVLLPIKVSSWTKSSEEPGGRKKLSLYPKEFLGAQVVD